MREIKFRAFLKEKKKMLPVTYLTLSDEESEQVGVADCNNEGCVLCVDFYDYEKVELMQYTGLQDKNGKEIFEGDIESDENGNLSVVCYLEKYGAYCFVPLVIYVHEDYENQVRYSYGYDCYFDNAIPSKYATVIGNIYENPELLEELQNGTK